VQRQPAVIDLLSHGGTSRPVGEYHHDLNPGYLKTALKMSSELLSTQCSLRYDDHRADL